MKDLAPIVEEDGTLRYEIHPGEERSIGGTVRINRLDHWVIIKMAWS